MNKTWVIIGVIILLSIAFLAWLFIESTKSQPPLPGEMLESMGANHVTDISGVTYNSNPPTSGPHFPVWAKRGVYDRILSDGYLIHSLEHGYIVISYNCDLKKPQGFLIKSAYAHEGEEIVTSTSSATQSAAPLHVMRAGSSGGMSFFTPQNPPEIEVELPEKFSSEECKQLVDNLDTFLDDYQRIIVVPRPGLDTKIALTAWIRLDKMGGFDLERIKTFIDAFHSKGPERTVE